MASKTNRFKFQVLDPGDDLSEDSYAFVNRDRYLLDALLEWLAEHHRHTGEDAVETELDPPELTLDTSVGGIPSGQRVRYKYTLVDADGFETASSSEAFIDTPQAVLEPAAPVITYETTGGTHIPGQYFYVLSAYQDFSTSETLALSPASVFVAPDTATNTITLELPDLPDGATGFNVYRRAPGSIKYFFLASVDLDVATPPETFEDDNSIDEDCDRSLPTENSTYSTNTITINIPGATPTVPDGYTWKIYRTYESGEYANSFLHWVVEETFEGSGIITPEYEDDGAGTDIGSPPSFDSAHGTPPKISLTDAAEVAGLLPPGLNLVPHEVTFGHAGPLIETEGQYTYRFPFDYGWIVSAAATLGPTFSPASQEVIVDVQKYTALTTTWDSVYSNPANRPTIAIGEFIGDEAAVDSFGPLTIIEGDALRVDIVQTGGGATPTDENLTVTVYMLVQSGSRTTSTDLLDLV